MPCYSIRIFPDDPLGPAGDGLSAGFLIHPVIAIDSETEAVLGLLDARIWTRTDEFIATPVRARALEDKGSGEQANGKPM